MLTAMALSGFGQDARLAVRLLRKHKSFSFATIVTLALGIGANAAVFSIFNAVLLSPLPFSEPGRLFLLRGQSQSGGLQQYSYLDFLDARRASRSFAGVAAWRNQGSNLVGIGDPIHLQTRQASAGLFSVLGVSPALGREFSEDDDRPGAAPVAIVSYEIWQRNFLSQRGVLDARIVLDGKSHAIVGILPKGFDLFGQIAVYTPLGQNDEMSMRQRQFRPGIWAVGRLRNDVSAAQARSELVAVSRQLAADHPATNQNWEFTLVPLRDSIVGDSGQILLLLQGAVALLFLIACANVANLFLARSADREDELAMRTIVGATRWHLVRQILTESLIVGLAGGIVGLAAVALAIPVLREMSVTRLPRVEQLSVDVRVVVLTTGLSVLAGVALGLVIALRHRREPSGVLPGNRITSARFARVQISLVATQVALSFVLLVGSGLMLRTLSRLLSVEMGFDPRNVLTAGVSFSPAVTSDPARIRATWGEILARTRNIPGVESAALNVSLPFQGEESIQYSTEATKASTTPIRSARAGAPTLDYWKVMKMSLVRGRSFTENDTATAPLVVVVDEQLAGTAFPGSDPVGQSIEVRMLGRARVVGVVHHIRYASLDEDVTGRSLAQIYLPFDQLPNAFLRLLIPGMRLVVRTHVSPESIEPSLRQAVASAASDQPLHNVATMEEIVGRTVAQRRLLLELIGAFGALALVLAAVGIAGIISYTMNCRLQEIAIRLALGAQPRQILELAIRRGMTIVVVGVAVGFAAWLGLMRVMMSWLYKVAPTDPITLVGVTIALSGVALTVICVAAHHAVRVDPMHVLRNN